MLSKDIWFDAATRANLAVGRSRRFGHSCGEGDVVKVSHTALGLEAYCFRCNDSIKIRRELSLKEKVALLKSVQKSTEEFKACTLPHDFTYDIPDFAGIWLYKAAVTKEVAKGYGIGWSPSMQRVLLPVYDADNNLAFVQARAVKRGQLPKYLNSYGKSAGSTLFLTESINQNTPHVVITEDILSAIRCSKYSASAALCGTSVNDKKMFLLLSAKTLLIWLDPDPAGQKGIRKFIKALALLHSDIRIIRADKDPKFLTNNQIQTCIKEAMCEH